MTAKDFERVCTIIGKYRGMEYTSDMTTRYINKAIQYLDVFEASPYKNALTTLANHMLKREM
jgi:geranylgeranyl pyrophosphate synthase